MDNRILIIILALVAALVYYYTKDHKCKNKGAVHVDVTPKTVTYPGLSGGHLLSSHGQVNAGPYGDLTIQKGDALLPPQLSNDYTDSNYKQNLNFDFSNEQPNQLQSAELLPGLGEHNAWEEVNPQGDNNLSMKNLIDSGCHYPTDTVGSSLRNPNLQLRSDPVITRVDVGPWHQSTIEDDTNRRHMEIGEF